MCVCYRNDLFVIFECIIAVKTLSTPPLNGLILPGVTRHSIIQLARHWGNIKVVEEPITMGRVVELLNKNQVCPPSI